MKLSYLRTFIACRVPNSQGVDAWMSEFNTQKDQSHLELEYNEEQRQIDVTFNSKLVCIIGHANVAFAVPE